MSKMINENAFNSIKNMWVDILIFILQSLIKVKIFGSCNIMYEVYTNYY